MRTPKGTKHISELTPELRAEFEDTGCEEGYVWYLRHQGLLTTEAETQEERDYPPPGKWFDHIADYHRWMSSLPNAKVQTAEPPTNDKQ